MGVDEERLSEISDGCCRHRLRTEKKKIMSKDKNFLYAASLMEKKKKLTNYFTTAKVRMSVYDYFLEARFQEHWA